MNQRQASEDQTFRNKLFLLFIHSSNIDQGQIHPNYTFNFHTELVEL